MSRLLHSVQQGRHRCGVPASSIRVQNKWLKYNITKTVVNLLCKGSVRQTDLYVQHQLTKEHREANKHRDIGSPSLLEVIKLSQTPSQHTQTQLTTVLEPKCIKWKATQNQQELSFPKLGGCAYITTVCSEKH